MKNEFSDKLEIVAIAEKLQNSRVFQIHKKGKGQYD